MGGSTTLSTTQSNNGNETIATEECLPRPWRRAEEEEEEEEEEDTNNGAAEGEDNDGELRVADQLVGSHTVAEEGVAGRREANCWVQMF